MVEGTARRAAIPGACALVLACVLLACGREASEDPRPVVATSVLPQQFFVERIAGDRVRVVVMIPPGASPASYAPTLEQLRALQDAILYVKVGHPGFPFEAAWLDALLEERRDLMVLDSAAGLDDDAGDPHVWLAPSRVRAMARRIETALAQKLPQHAAAFAANRTQFEQELDALDAELDELLASKRGWWFLVFHPAWGHLAGDYGLVQRAIEEGGVEPDARRLAAVMADARRAGVRTVLAQPQFSTEAPELVAREIGASVVSVDPLAYDWDANLRRSARVIAEAAVP